MNVETNAKTGKWTRPEIAAVSGLLAGVAGILTLWASGVEFPFYPPPGSLIMSTGALIFILTRPRLKWAPLVPALFGLSSIVGFLVEGAVSGQGIANLTGDSGAGAVVGQAIQQAGGVLALVAGVIATRANYGRRDA